MNPKLRKRLMIVIALAIIYLIFVINLHKIKFAIGMLSIYKQEKNTQSIAESEDNSAPVKMDKAGTVDNPLQSIINNKGNVDKIEEPVDNSLSTVVKLTPSQNTIAKPTKSYMEIIEEYNDVLEKLRVKFEDNLDELIEQGIKEYKDKEISSSDLSIKYLNKGSNLEKISDGQFNTIIKIMKKELETNGHDSSIIKELKSYYEEFKRSKKQDIISKGLKYIE